MAGTAFADKAEGGGHTKEDEMHRSHRSWASSASSLRQRSLETHQRGASTAGLPIKLRAEGHLHIQGRMGTGQGVVERSESYQAPDAALDKGRPLQVPGRPNRNYKSNGRVVRS